MSDGMIEKKDFHPKTLLAEKMHTFSVWKFSVG